MKICVASVVALIALALLTATTASAHAVVNDNTNVNHVVKQATKLSPDDDDHYYQYPSAIEHALSSVLNTLFGGNTLLGSQITLINQTVHDVIIAIFQAPH